MAVISVSTRHSQCDTFVYTISCSGVTDKYGDTPLDICTRQGYTDIAKYLKSVPTQCEYIIIIYTYTLDFYVRTP